MKLRTIALAAVMGIAAAAPASAQQYPSKPVRVIVGYGAGGVTDLFGRMMADEIGKRLGQAFVVENRTGASALVAATAVKNAAPDGYTIFHGSVTEFTPVMMQSSLVAPKELTPVAGMGAGDWFLYVPAQIGVNSLKDLAAYAKANQGKFRFGAVATVNQMLFALVAQRLGFGFENVPYKASDQAITAMFAGDVQASFNAAAGHVGHVQAGKLKAVAILSPQRSPVMPDVATTQEQGLALQSQFRQGWWGTPGMPAEAQARLTNAAAEALKSPELRERILKMALQATYETPSEMVRTFESDLRLFQEAAQLIGFKPQ